MRRGKVSKTLRTSPDVRQKREKSGKKWAVTAVTALLLIILYGVIYGFSGQDAEESGGVSRAVTEKAVDIADTLSGRKWTKAFKEELTNVFEHPVRKLAHFTEYTCMGLLVYILWRQWMQRGRMLYAVTIVWGFLSAAFDELHQTRIPGRHGGLPDVLLDTCGVIFGMLLCIMIDKKMHDL